VVLINDLLSQYGEYKRRLDAREVLARYGARNCTEQTNRDGTTEIVHSCLLDQVEPHHAHGDAHPSAWCNVDKNLYVCSAYWSGDLIHLIQKLEGKETLAETMPVVGEMLSGATRGVLELTEELDRILHFHEITAIEIPTYAPQVLRPWLVSHPYMYDERGISPQTLAELRVGYDARENRIVIPHFWDGALVGWQKRAIPERPGWPGSAEPHPKYRSSSGFPKSETLYGFDRFRACASGQALAVESPMSVIRSWDLGLRNPTAVATFGAKTSVAQVELLSDARLVYVWFDADEAGYHGSHKLVDALHTRTEVRVVIPIPGVDLGDHTSIETVYAALDSAEPAALWLARWRQG
jgi:Toprim domain-containing protein